MKIDYQLLESKLGRFNIIRELQSSSSDIGAYKDIKSELVFSDSDGSEEKILTIVIPTFERSKTLITTLKSVAFQKPKIKYSIMVIDNSGIGSCVVEEKKQAIREMKTGRIEYYVNQSNIGMTGNWNRALELVKTKYIAFLHDDDLLAPWYIEYIASCIAIIEKNGFKMGALKARFKYFQDENQLSMNSNIKRGGIIECSIKDILFKEMRITNPPTCGIVFNKEALIACGGFRESLYPVADFMPQINLLSQGYRLFMTEDVLAYYRLDINESMKKKTMITTLCLDMICLDYTFSRFRRLRKYWKRINELYYCNRVEWYLEFARVNGEPFQETKEIDVLDKYSSHGHVKSCIYKCIRKINKIIYGSKIYH